MTFDKSKVYTAVNADELQVGSWCAFADTLATLKENVEQEYAKEIVDIKDEREEDRFVLSNGNKYSLVYLLGFPTDPKYKPFSNIEKAREIISKHGGWVKNIKLRSYHFITDYDREEYEGDKDDVELEGVSIYQSFTSFAELRKDFIFADDGTPCGELVDE